MKIEINAYMSVSEQLRSYPSPKPITVSGQLITI